MSGFQTNASHEPGTLAGWARCTECGARVVEGPERLYWLHLHDRDCSQWGNTAGTVFRDRSYTTKLKRDYRREWKLRKGEAA